VERLTGHVELQELLGAYALDAVEPDEAAAIERHLPTCPRCRNELAEHREVAALLGYAGGDAPSGVWDRIIASLEEPPPALMLTRAPNTTVGPPARGNVAATSDGATRSDPDAEDHDGMGDRGIPRIPPPIHARAPYLPPPTLGDDKVVPISRGRAWRRGPVRGRGGPRRTVEMRVMVAVATAAAVIVALLGIQVGRLQAHKSDSTNLAALAFRVADADPSARHLTLASPDGVHKVKAVIIADGATYLDARNLAPLPSDETYQMWGVVDGARVSLGVFGDTPAYHSFTTPPTANVLAMTVEQRGGVVSSTKTPVVAGVVPGA
jgi:hypothetical protein